MDTNSIQHRPVDILFPGFSEQVDMHICTTCGNAWGTFRDALSQREAGISGMCQECQDEMWGV